MHNIQPAGQTWPAEAFYLARQAHDSANLDCLFPKNILLALEHDNNKKILARHEI
jgi:hypothetical protein